MHIRKSDQTKSYFGVNFILYFQNIILGGLAVPLQYLYKFNKIRDK